MKDGDSMLNVFLTKINFGWRLFATGLAFLTFGVGGLLLGTSTFSILNLVTKEGEKREKKAQRLVQFFFSLFVGLLRVLGVAKVNYHGIENLPSDPMAGQKGKLVIANHPTLIDVVVIISKMQSAQCIIKHELFENFFLSKVVRGANYVRNDEDAEKLIDDCVEVLNSGRNLVIFPEGTRTPESQILKFRRGFAVIAERAGADLVPVTISTNHRTLTKGSSWCHIPPERLEMNVNIHKAISVNSVVAQDLPASLKSRRISKYVLTFFFRKVDV